MRKKVGLVLSGGAALGYAHIGVIKELEKHKIPIDIVVGTSMGGLVGAAYCSGASVEDMLDIANKFKTINFLDVNFNKSGIFSGNGMMTKINKIIPDIDIENMKIPFACVGCDINNEKEIVFDKGNLRNAVRTTISIPGLFVPVKDGDNNLVDGGVINNVPDNIAKKMGADIIICVDVIKNYKLKGNLTNIIDTLFYSINLLTKEMQRKKKKYYDVLIAPDLSECKQMGFNTKTVETCVRIGEEETKKYIKEIKELLKSK